VKVYKHESHLSPIQKIIKKKLHPSFQDTTEIDDNTNPTEISNKLMKAHKYNNKVLLLVGSVGSGKSTFAKKVQNEYNAVNQRLQEIFKDNSLKDSEIRKLKDSLNYLQNTIDTTTNDQLIAINAKYAEEIDNYKSQLQRQNQEIIQLNNDLATVRALLQKNAETKIPLVSNYDDCKKIAYVFRKVNNQIMRKKEIISTLKNKILPNYRNISSNYTLIEDIALMKNIVPMYILNDMENKINEIDSRLNAHISFFELEKYNIEAKISALENPAVKSTPQLDDFCQRLNDINLYWSQNEENFYQDDIQLTNIYEDLSGAVRVYVKIRPNDENTIRVIDPNNPHSLEVDCPSPQDPQTFTNFYGVFNETFTNKEVFTGTKNTDIDNGFEELQIPNLDTSPGNIGLYNSFRQVENGYSIIMFGYGLSGSGKTRTLFGNTSENIPGLIHYTLANLNNVQSISIKNIFEHYISKQNLQQGYLTGKIINLMGKIPPVFNGNNTYNVPQVFEDQELIKYNLEEYRDISMSDIPYQLEQISSIIETHRIEKGRIKETPNNPTSSRSHLFMVFKIYFTTGKTGYLTFVDMAGRESPIDIYETFMDPRKYSLASFMLNGKSKKQIPLLQEQIYDEFKGFDVSYIYDMIEEGFFINETINHLTYFFQNKNNKKTNVKKQLQGLDSYDISRFFVSPKEEQIGNIKQDKNCLMIPILQYLDNQGKSTEEFKPTKFIMMCNVRQEPKYCKQIIETLEFANNVKST
jgi:nucleoside-triphosphatase THEP1